MLDHKVNMLYTVFLSFFILTRRIFSIIFNEAVFFLGYLRRVKRCFSFLSSFVFLSLQVLGKTLTLIRFKYRLISLTEIFHRTHKNNPRLLLSANSNQNDYFYTKYFISKFILVFSCSDQLLLILTRYILHL